MDKTDRMTVGKGLWVCQEIIRVCQPGLAFSGTSLRKLVEERK